MHTVDTPRARCKIAIGVFCIDAAFNRMTAQDQIVLGKREWLSGGDADLFAYKINPCHLFRNRMLDLDTGIHLTEEEILIAIYQEFYGTGIDVADFLRQILCSCAHFLPGLGIKETGRRFLQ